MHIFRFCALAILAFCTPGVAEDTAREDEERLPDCAWYLGTIGGKDVQIGLAIDANAARPRRVTGSYFYASIGFPLTLEGTLSKGGLVLTESDGERDTGRLEGAWDGRGDLAKLEWLSPDGKRRLPVRLRKVAGQKRDERFDKRGMVFDAAFPHFLERTPLTRAAGAALAAAVEREFREYAKSLRGAPPPPDGVGWTVSWVAQVVYYSPQCVSILACWNAYTGGAHGNNGSVGMTFVLRGDKAVQLKLADLFKPKTGWLTRLSNVCVRDLQRQEAGSVPDSFTAADLSKFTITPGGLTIYFDPYEVGCYAEGPYEVTVRWTRLDGTLSEACQSAARVRIVTADNRPTDLNPATTDFTTRIK